MRTRIKNVSPSARFYGFLPPHGMLMAKDQEVILDGDLRTNLAIGRKQYSRATELAALQHALDGLDIEYETLTDAQSSSSPVPSSSSSAEPEPSSSSSSSAEPEPSSSSSSSSTP
jgi:hypothetical protein